MKNIAPAMLFSHYAYTSNKYPEQILFCIQKNSLNDFKQMKSMCDTYSLPIVDSFGFCDQKKLWAWR